MRPKPLLKLLHSVREQTYYPNEILVIDGSENNETEAILNNNIFKNLDYYNVGDEHRGLTKQRNYGVSLVSKTSEIVCFLDDDTELYDDYFEQIIKTFKDQSIVGVGGVAVNENRWFKIKEDTLLNSKKYYILDDYAIKESLRNVIRNRFKLQSNLKPGLMPDFSHTRTYSYPLNNKIYAVDLLVGMSFNFRKTLFEKVQFSTYFEGYGLYEDADFCIKALKYGRNVINTAARLNHYHDASGRPNKYKYGKMVIRNGWYVWRAKYPNPTLKSVFKFHSNVLLLMFIQFTNSFYGSKKVESFTETIGRLVGWLSLFFNKPKS
jgi:glycosyltransferase involved in cell wall biosynthesis